MSRRIEQADPGVELRVSGIPACEPDRVPMVAAGLGWHGWTVADGDDLDAAVLKAGGPAATWEVALDCDGIRLNLEPHPESALARGGYLIAQGSLSAADARALARALVAAADLSDLSSGEASHPWGRSP